MDDNDLQRLLLGGMAPPSPEERAKMVRRDNALDTIRGETVSRLALEGFGIALSHSDGIWMLHPALAGVVRRALRDAFDAGAGAVTKEIITAMLDAKVGKP